MVQQIPNTLTQRSLRADSGNVAFDSKGCIGVDDAVSRARVATKAYARIVRAWQLDDLSARRMISVDSHTWAQIKGEAWSNPLEKEQLMRISAIINLYEVLHSCFNDDLADRWVKRPNTGSIFSGRKPVDVMIEGGLPVMMKTWHYMSA